MSQMVVYLRLSRKVVNELEKKAPPEEWGRILEELLKRAKGLQPKKAPRGEKVELELYLPKTLPRKLSARARVWGVSWDDVIWTLLTAKTDEVKRASTKKASLKPKKKKTTKVTPPAPRKKRAITSEEEDFEVVISPMKRIKMKEDIESTLEQLKALESNLSKIESDIRFFTGDEEKAKRRVEEYRKEIRELERKLKKALDKIGEERLKESELDRIGMVIAEAEAFRGKIFDEIEAWEALGPEYYEPDLELPEEEPLSDEELLERYFEAKKASQESKKKEEQKEKPIRISASESFRRFLALARDLGADTIYINDNTAVFLDSYRYTMGMTTVPAKGHFEVELPPVQSFSKLEALIIDGNLAIWKYADGREYETNVEKLSEDDIGYRLAKAFKEAFDDTKETAIAHLTIGGPKLYDKLERTPKVFNQLKRLEVSKRGDMLFWDALNGYIVVGNYSEIVENLKKGKRDGESIWKYVVGFPKEEWKDVRHRKTPALIALSTKPFEKIAHHFPEDGVANIYFDRGMIVYQFGKMGEGKAPQIKLLQIAFTEDGLGKIRKYYERYERLPLQYRQLNALD